MYEDKIRSEIADSISLQGKLQYQISQIYRIYDILEKVKVYINMILSFNISKRRKTDVPS